ncbi:unnamed protein product [Caenorhabditis auriculariae]|uniref:MYND-type domain-containing protein n=1 Tax=Caenorhabditis auriculariae TaxID=2777116 RepID=A0A8S1HHZ0_9PELO|nr:unnamed protein product [Caenorhabditis auriculariae]
MERIVEELPYASVVDRPFIDAYCARCVERISDDSESFSCDYCSEVKYCKASCQRKDWNDVHAVECAVLRSSQSERKSLSSTTRLALRVIFQLYGPSSSKSYVAFNGSTIEKLETNYDAIRSNTEYNHFLVDIMAIIKSCCHSLSQNEDMCSTKLEAVSKTQISSIVCAVLANAFSIVDELKGESVGLGLYHNHACASDAHVVFDGRRALLMAPVGTSYIQQLTISYVSRMLPTFERQKNISRVHFFVCKCQLCQDDQKEARASACPCSDEKCDGFCPVSSVFISNQYKCVKCGALPKFHHAEVHQFMVNLLGEMERLEKLGLFSQENNSMLFSSLRELRDRYKKFLASCNIGMLLLNEQIASSAARLPPNSITPEELVGIGLSDCDEYIERLGIGYPETTRRLYIACVCVNRAARSSQYPEIFQKAFESSLVSHGETHPLTKEIRKLSSS